MLEKKDTIEMPSDDSDDDILIKKHSELVDNMSTEDLEVAKPRQPKAKTKVAKAKALIRKGIKTNTKIIFDEEGNVSRLEIFPCV